MKKITLLLLILFSLSAQRYAMSQITVNTVSTVSTASVTTVAPYQSTIVPVTALASASTSVDAIYMEITYDQTVVSAINVTQGAGLTGGTLNAGISTPGLIILNWYANTISINSLATIFNIEFRRIGPGVSSPVTLSVSDFTLSSTNYTSTMNSGTLSFQADAPHTIAPDALYCYGQTISVPITVNDFNTIGAVSLRLSFDISVLTYSGSFTINPLLPVSSLPITNTVPGTIRVASTNFPVSGVTLPAGATLFTLNFTYNGGYTGLTWLSSPNSYCEYTNQGFIVLPDTPFATYYTNGSVGPAPTTWDGSESNVWNTLANWSCDVPTAYTDVIIGTSPNYPVIPAAADITVKSLTINDGSVTVSPTAKLTVTNTLTNAVGNTGLVIKSDATGTGSLINNTAGVSATIERYITGSEDLTSNRYHLVSHPFTESYLSGAWMDSYLFDCDELTGTWIANGIETNNTLLATKGYMIYYPGTSKLYSHTGTLQTGTSTIPVTYTAGSAYPGYNLVANMYPCALDFDVAGNWGGGVISNKIWIWNASSGNYGSHIRSGANTNGVTNIIPEGQGFFVEATTSGDLTIAPAARVHNSAQAFLKNTDITENMFLLKASGNNFSDEIVVQFREDATTGYDELIEAKKMVGQLEAPQLSSVTSDDANLSINSLPFSAIDALVPVKFSLNANVDVTFDASGMESFYEGIPIYLEDHLLNTVIDLRANPVYVFSHNTGNAVNRFALRFMGVTDTPEYNEIKGNVFASNGRIFADVPSMSQSLVNISVFDAQGRQISNSKMIMSGTIELQAPSATGVYMVRVLNGSKSFTGRVLVN